ncbi:xanthine dehydrogenase accessory protein XdhC [Anianabacter salinae]|uniref:xanthine dehydrogenase accessory protein XdhC n=1 Tax=Anianabacter salinae TaxID=2851023 RepID=UPI00225E62B3|nr:xanthine dehydrogenase accessory protein XdhC [Anianabacter salinae]MBV0913867.1 xanthine dehydrogenase accessory protein XdhC [Anianabacter salinae]
MSLDLAALRAAVARHRRVARVVVAEAKGSAPREPGTAMLVFADGQDGTIGGGALEWEAARAARAMLETGGARVDRMPLGPALGQCCGGAVTLVTEVYDTAALERIGSAVHARRVEGARAMPLAVTRALSAARSGSAQTPMMLSEGWLAEPVELARRALWIWGAGHVGRALVSVLAPLPDVAITWVDTSADRFPDTIPDGVIPRVAAKPAEALRHAPPDADHLILTYSHALDLDLCHAVLSHGFRSAGVIGSATKWARFRSRLAALGHSDAQISRIRCPIGQKSLGKHPQAIAVGVAADLLSTSYELEHRQGAVG